MNSEKSITSNKLNTRIFNLSRFSSDNFIGYAMITPFYLFLSIFILLPILINIYLSFTNYDLNSMSFIKFQNYKHILTDNFFKRSLVNTGVYTFFSMLFSMTIGLAIAVFLNNKVFGTNFSRTAFFLPHITSMVAISMVWLWIYDPAQGILNQFLSLFGIARIEWLFDVNYAMPAIIFMSVWKFVGYNMVIYLAGLQGVPGYLYEAAKIDGASPWRQFRSITLPLLSPVTFFLFVTGIINNFNVFEQVIILTDGGPMNSTTTIVHQIYRRAFQDFQLGYGASLSVVLLVIVAFITFVNFRFGRRGHDIDAG